MILLAGSILCLIVSVVAFSLGGFFDAVGGLIFLGIAVFCFYEGCQKLQVDDKSKIIRIASIIAVIVVFLLLLKACAGMFSNSGSYSHDPIFDKDPSSWTPKEQKHFYDVYID